MAQIVEFVQDGVSLDLPDEVAADVSALTGLLADRLLDLALALFEEASAVMAARTSTGCRCSTRFDGRAATQKDGVGANGARAVQSEDDATLARRGHCRHGPPRFGQPLTWTDGQLVASFAVLAVSPVRRDTGPAMSQEENVEPRAMAEAGYRTLNSGDLDGFLALVAEDVEFTSMVAEAEGTTFRGHEGVRDWWQTVRGAFQDVWWELLEVRASGEWGVTKFCLTATLEGARVEQTMWQAVKLLDGKVAWWAFFRTEREALEAAGLSG